MQKNLLFFRSIQSVQGVNVVPKEWDNAVEAFEKKDYKLTVLSILRYLGKAVKDSEDNWSYAHGSTTISIKIENDRLYVFTPFLRIASSRRIPLLRQIVQMNFSPLNLSQVRLKDDLLYFDFSCPLELCEPFKIYDVFREVCINADANDDQFIDKFEATWDQVPTLERYDENMLQETFKQFNLLIDEALVEVEYYENKRQLSLAWDIAVITLLKIDYLIQPQGSLRSNLEKAIEFAMGQTPIPEKINRAKQLLKDFKNTSLASLTKDMYIIEVFIPYKFYTNEEKIKTFLEPAVFQAIKEKDSGDYLSATLTLSYNILNLFYHNNIGLDVQGFLEKALIKSSSKDLKESADILIKAANKLISKKGSKTPNAKSGFLKRLFKI